MTKKIREFVQSYFHGTKAKLQVGDSIVAGMTSNYEAGRSSKYVYLTSNLNVAAWGAELAEGKGFETIYVVEPTGPIENDPNVTDKKFPGNPTNSYRTKEALQVIGIVTHWQGHTPEEVAARKDAIRKLFESGAGIIE